MPVCLSAGAAVAVIATQMFTLAWNHSVERVRWEEDWRVEAGRLTIDEARIRGTGAGMEPPAGSVLVNGMWHYRPSGGGPQIRLEASGYSPDYELCFAGGCRRLGEVLPRDGEDRGVVLTACDDS